ncbi:hypothetical protein D6853_14190 [Butyrivibrio sp. X503]|nr:hypothetical protein D6853_14190 [Butyrivibrio sp. X503]
MAAGTVAGLFISVLKAVFSMLSWFLGLILKLFKFLVCLLPVTAVCVALLFVLNLFILVTGNIGGLISITESSSASEGIKHEAEKLLIIGSKNVMDTYINVKTWWMSEVYPFKGSVAFFFLILFTVIMLIPVATVLLMITVFESYGIVLFIAVAIDAVIYVLRAILGKSFTEQFMGRYYKMFPESGKKHYEKKYANWLKKGGYEEAANAEGKKRRTADEFYGEDYEDEEDLDGDDYEDSERDYFRGKHGRRRDRRRYDRYNDDEYGVDEYDEEYEEEDPEYYDEEDYEDDEYNEDYIEDHSRRGRYSENDSQSASSGARQTVNVGSFNFFAGCNSKESVERKYKSLVKLYHPDNMDGDTAALQEINVQYTEAKKRF